VKISFEEREVKIEKMPEKKPKEKLLPFEEYIKRYLPFEIFKKDVLVIDSKMREDDILNLYEKHCISRYDTYLRPYETNNDPGTIL
jgi:hypothetical protein